MRATRKETFGDLLRRYRKAAGRTQEELAEQANLSFRTISDLERGAKHRPHRDTIQLLAGALGLSDEQRTEFEQAARRSARAGSTATSGAPDWDSGGANPARARHDLPGQTTSFVGREHELEQVRRLMLRAGARLVTLTGPGGIGKTRLALEVAASLRDDFSHGVYFVNLTSITEPDLVILEIAQELGVKQVAGESLPDRVKDFLYHKHTLLTLDNFEQVASVAPLLVELLIAAPGLKLLVTSREVLRVSGEHVFLVPPLSLPDLAALPGPEMLPDYEAVALFLQRAAAARPGFVLTAENAVAIATLCAGLDGLPLAIELAAARLRLFPPGAMLARLGDRLAWLTEGPRDRTNRQQTLRATLDWSYNLLDPLQQVVFARLAVFAGGCTLEVADAVAGAGFDAIASLLDKSLLQQAVGRDGEARFHMLETIREYGREWLVESGQDIAIRTRHADYFAELALQAEAMLRSPSRGAWLTRLEAEQDNLRAALAWCLEGRGGAETGMRLAGALVWYWIRSYPTEGRRWVQKAGAAPSPDSPPGLRGWCQAGAAFLAWLHADRGAARADLKGAIDLLRRSPDRLKLAHALGWLGMVESSQERYLPARAALDEALTIFAELGQEWDRAMGLQYSGISEIQAWATGGSRALALQHLQESYQIFVTLGDDWARAGTINRLALAIALNGNYPAALALFSEGLRLARQERSPYATADALQALADVMRMHGDYAGAIPLLREAVAVRRELGERQAEAGLLDLLGFCMLALGDLEQARALCEESLTLHQQSGDAVRACWAMRNLASVSRLAGEPARALKLYERALSTIKGGEAPWFHLICLIDLVALLGPSREPQTAAALLGAAEALEESIPYFSWPVSESTNFDSRMKTENIAAARVALSAESFARAWSAGRTLPPEQALDLGLTTVRQRLAAEILSG